MNKIFRGIYVRNLLRFQGTRNFTVDRRVTDLNAYKAKYLLNIGRRNSRFQNILKINIRCFSRSLCLKEQSSTSVKDVAGSRSPEESAEKSELDSKIALYVDLAGGDVEKKKKILMILMEHEVAKLEGKRVPSKLNVEEMKELLNLHSISSRVRYLAFLFTKESAKIVEQRRKEIRRKRYEEWLQEKPNIKPPEHIAYGIGNNTLLVRVRRKSVMRFYNQRLANSALYGQKIVVDLDFDSFMRRQDSNNCCEQLLEMYSVNRRDSSPYDLFFCNAHQDHPTVTTFRRYMPNLYAPDNFITLTDLSYLDIFPKESLVYITPTAKEPLQTYDHNAIYIIGGLVDKCIREPVVLAKTKREGVRAVHLPYEEYIMWGRGSRSLPLNQIMQILLEMKRTADWNKAFRYVPKRKIVRNLDLFSEF